jgi:hypothetical protein
MSHENRNDHLVCTERRMATAFVLGACLAVINRTVDAYRARQRHGMHAIHAFIPLAADPYCDADAKTLRYTQDVIWTLAQVQPASEHDRYRIARAAFSALDVAMTLSVHRWNESEAYSQLLDELGDAYEYTHPEWESPAMRNVSGWNKYREEVAREYLPW